MGAAPIEPICTKFSNSFQLIDVIIRSKFGIFWYSSFGSGEVYSLPSPIGTKNPSLPLVGLAGDVNSSSHCLQHSLDLVATWAYYWQLKTFIPKVQCYALELAIWYYSGLCQIVHSSELIVELSNLLQRLWNNKALKCVIAFSSLLWTI